MGVSFQNSGSGWDGPPTVSTGGWQSIADAFDLCEAGTGISLAVGSDYVIALVHRFDRPPSNSSASSTEFPASTPGSHRWFVARVR